MVITDKCQNYTTFVEFVIGVIMKAIVIVGASLRTSPYAFPYINELLVSAIMLLFLYGKEMILKISSLMKE